MTFARSQLQNLPGSVTGCIPCSHQCHHICEHHSSQGTFGKRSHSPFFCTVTPDYVLIIHQLLPRQELIPLSCTQIKAAGVPTTQAPCPVGKLKLGPVGKLEFQATLPSPKWPTEEYPRNCDHMICTLRMH